MQPARLVHVHHVSGLVVADLDPIEELLGDRELGEDLLGREVARVLSSHA